MSVRLALPTGDLRRGVGELLARAGIVAPGYEPDSRVLRSVAGDDSTILRVFREKDIPIQVALGNYDVGICSDTWLSEQSVRFPLQRVVRVGSLPGPRQQVWVAASATAGLEPGELPRGDLLRGARIVSEFPNLADLVARLVRGATEGGADVAFARTADGAHPVFALVRVSLRSSLDAFLASGGRKIDAWTATLALAEVDFDDEADAFRNLNTRDELAAAGGP